MNLDAIKARNLPRLKWGDILKSNEPLSAEDEKALADYFSAFTLLADNACPGCGKNLTGSLLEVALGVATFTWGICHGEGFCSACRYPARALHYKVGPIERLELVLPYHPDDLIQRTPQGSTTEKTDVSP